MRWLLVIVCLVAAVVGFEAVFFATHYHARPLSAAGPIRETGPADNPWFWWMLFSMQQGQSFTPGSPLYTSPSAPLYSSPSKAAPAEEEEQAAPAEEEEPAAAPAEEDESFGSSFSED